MNDTISRRAAIDALWEALYEYEDKTKKQFQESDELDVEDWILHREFVQNMNDIDRQTILNLPSTQPEIIRCKDCKQFRRWIDTNICFCDITESKISDNDFCSKAERREDE